MQETVSSLSLAQNIVDLYWFTQIVDAGSFSDAAQSHNLSKSSLSRRISQLEGRLGVQLLHRNPRHLTLTSIGSLVYQHTLTMVGAAQKATNCIQHALGTPSGKLSISVPAILNEWLMPILADFSHTYPQVQLNIYAADAMHDINSQSIDLALSLFAAPSDSSQIVARPLAKLLFANFSSTQMNLPEPLKQIQVNNQPASANQELTLNLHAENYLIALHAAQAGLGYANLPLLACHTGLKNGDLKYYDNAIKQRTLFAFSRPHRVSTLATRELLEFLIQGIVKTEPLGIAPI